MALDVGQIGQQMLDAALPILSQGGAKVGDYAATEFKKIADRIKVIAEKVIIGEIHAEDAPMLLQVQTDVATGVLMTASGLGEIVVQNAINAALDIVKGTVNTALGFGLIV